MRRMSRRYYGWDQLPVMLNTQEVCCVLRVTEQTVRSMIRDGRLNAIKVGRGWRVERDALKRYVEGGGAA